MTERNDIHQPGAGSSEQLTRAQVLEQKRTERNTANWKGIKVQRRRGVAEETLQREADALAYCKEQGHRLREQGRQACRLCLHEANMGRLGQQGPELPLLPAHAQPVHRQIDQVLADFGQYGLEDICQQVNDMRAARGEQPITLNTCSSRARELRGMGRTLQTAANPSGSDTYWYDRPGQPAALEPEVAS